MAMTTNSNILWYSQQPTNGLDLTAFSSWLLSLNSLWYLCNLKYVILMKFMKHVNVQIYTFYIKILENMVLFTPLQVKLVTAMTTISNVLWYSQQPTNGLDLTAFSSWSLSHNSLWYSALSNI